MAAETPATADLFGEASHPWQEPLGPGALVLHGYAAAEAAELLQAVEAVAAQAPFRHMATPGGYGMSVAMTNCGPLGWTSSPKGYRYSSIDPLSGHPWPAMPECFLQLAARAAAAAGFAGFVPDACLVNRYLPGARMSLHQDKDERDFSQPLVSVSLGLPIVFLFGGMKRSEPARRITLGHGDVVVWGGPDRLRYHGVLALKPGRHPLLGEQRINLTLRKAG